MEPIRPIAGITPPEVRDPEEVLRPAQTSREELTGQVNSHMPWAASLDLGTGVAPLAYAEYTGNETIDRVSIKIIDPSTGGVIRELPHDELLSFSEAQLAYLELGRRHGGRG